MSHLPFTILAYLLNGVAVLVDKFLLTKAIPDPLIYVFYFSLVSLVVLFILPFVPNPGMFVFILASISTLLWTTGAYSMLKGLQIGQASRVIPIIGTLIPLILLAFYGITSQSLTINQIWAATILTLGLIAITAPSLKGKIIVKEFIFELISSVLFAFSYVILHQAYQGSNIASVFIYSRLVLIPVGIVILLVPIFRNRVFKSQLKLNFFSKFGIIFLIGQTCAGISELLLTLSVALANPALVNSLQGVQYIFLFLASLILAKNYPNVFHENLKKMHLGFKIIGILLIGFGLFVLAFYGQNNTKKSLKFGVTYSPQYASSLGLDPKQTFIKMLDDLNVKLVRLPVYWDEVEKVEGVFDFSDIDFYLTEAAKRDVEIILGLGYKQPRWPECFNPSWAKNLPRGVKEEKILNLVQNEVQYFTKYQNIKVWQLENEPFLHFGACEKPDKQNFKTLEKEFQIVKSLDQKPILITDSGELSNWSKAITLGDKFGFTLYRRVWSPLFGVVEYPIPPFYYSLKKDLNQALFSNKSPEVIVSELQAEPWSVNGKHLADTPLDDQTKLFSVYNFKQNINFAKQTGVDEVVLWGVEWWYYMNSLGHPEYLNFSKTLF